MRVRDGHDGPVHEADPVGDLRDVLDGGGEPHQGHVLGRVHDDLFPHRPASLVAHVVALVEDHELEAVEAARVEHVAEDLGGHDDHGRARVDLDVAREDAHALLAKLPAEVRVLLVRQRLERRGVGDAAPAREGASVALHDRSEAAVKPVAAIAHGLGREVLTLGGDLAQPAEADRAVAAVVARFGRLDVLVNNSANPPTGSPTEQVTDGEWRAMMSRLLDEPFYCLRAALRVMRPAKRGKIINMSSAAAFPGLANYAAYSAARAGVNGLTKAVG